MEEPYARIVADSRNEQGVRLTSMEVRFHRFVLSEFNTHRVFSRNSASSRAIPIAKQLSKLQDGLAIPLSWPTEKPGMQGGPELEPSAMTCAEKEWVSAADAAIEAVRKLQDLRVHKSVTNRLLEPFMWHTVVVTSTAWENFLLQRDSDLAQPEIRVVAQQMRKELDNSSPTDLVEGQWHLPYVRAEDRDAGLSVLDLVKVSAARCARTSYLTQDGSRDVEKDFLLYERLVSARPAHWSPLEHVATPWVENQMQHDIEFQDISGSSHTVRTVHLPRVGNLRGWRSLRTEVEAAQTAVTFK
ncbi:FAD-dependent thymidylate synthase [Nocardioides sp. SYSU D00038]|uniref:FAD-dependent thymidylate synthase n=1 Tax=Nocardioides sp. SYSU D00038 TaxID=2812554 RepID=UPI001967063E